MPDGLAHPKRNVGSAPTSGARSVPDGGSRPSDDAREVATDQDPSRPRAKGSEMRAGRCADGDVRIALKTITSERRDSKDRRPAGCGLRRCVLGRGRISAVRLLAAAHVDEVFIPIGRFVRPRLLLTARFLGDLIVSRPRRTRLLGHGQSPLRILSGAWPLRRPSSSAWCRRHDRAPLKAVDPVWCAHLSPCSVRANRNTRPRPRARTNGHRRRDEMAAVDDGEVCR